MNLLEWEEWILSNTGTTPDLGYSVIGLCGETGEVAEWFKKKVLRTRESPLTDADLLQELGDVLYYLSAIARAKGWTLQEVMTANVEKLQARQREKGSDYYTPLAT